MAQGVPSGEQPPACFRLLGELEVAVAQRPLAPAGVNLRLVLAALALHRGRVVPTDSLAEELWGPSPAVDVAAGLQALVSRSRRALAASAATIVATAGGYRLEADGSAVDIEEFEELLARAAAAARGSCWTDAAQLYRSALRLCRGQALREFAERDFARATATRLDEARLAAVESLGAVLLELGECPDAVALLEPHVAAHPYREQACAHLMLALHRSGRRADALAAYRTVRRAIAEDLGLDPGAGLRRVEAAILADDLPPAPRAMPALPARAQSDPPAPVPAAPADAFLGRRDELAELTALLGTQRLITVWGPGGMGKTRLVRELMLRTTAEFPDGVWFAPLAPLTDPGQVPAAAMASLGMLGSPGTAPTDSLATYLRDRRSLLVLDNCEHVLDGAAALAHALLAACPRLRILATSREPLAVPAEHVWAAPALRLPDPGTSAADLEHCDAAALFVHRARMAAPGFAVTAANAPVVADVCRRLDGLPLALELAAARVRTLGVRGVADGLDDRFALLTGGARTADARHRTLQAAIDWSFDPCPAPEQELLVALSVFGGDFDASAAAAVAGRDEVGALVALSALVDRSLVVAEHAAGRTRYRLLESIRRYAADRAQNTGSSRELTLRHLRYFAMDRLPDSYVWLTGATHWIDGNLDAHNFRAAMACAVAERDAAAALRLAARMWTYWASVHDPEETPLAWFEQILDLPEAQDSPDLALVTVGRAWYAGDEQLARRACEIADHTGEPRLRSLVYQWAAGVLACAHPDEARRLATTGIASAEAAGYTANLARLHHRLAWIALAQDDLASARTHAERVVFERQDERPHPLDTVGLGALAVVLAVSGDGAQAQAAAERGLEIARGGEMPMLLSLALVRASTAAVFNADWPRAAELLHELLALLRRLASGRWVADALNLTALTLEGTGRPAGVVALVDAARSWAAHLNETPGGEVPAIARAVAAARDRAATHAGSPIADPSLDGVLAAAERELDVPALPQPPNNLSSPVGRFLGRRAELIELSDLLATHRLLTLWGPGGAGKSRLALELATRHVSGFADGAFFVELAPVSRPDEVAPALMAALGMAGVDGEPAAALATYLSGRQSLVVLDNCEHLVDAVAALAQALLARGPRLRLVATSREPLGVPEEVVWPTRALALPESTAELEELVGCDAVEFFAHRVEAAQAGFVLTAGNAARVVEICRRLDGMPLALELAAARVRTYGVAGVAARLDDRFRLLAAGNRAADPRQQTLRATVDWSYELLAPDERELLDCLSVFPGTFDAAAAAGVGAPESADPDRALAGLVERSLVVSVPTPDGGVRYRLLETIRQYGADRIAASGRTEELRDRHLAHFSGGRLLDWVDWLHGEPSWQSLDPDGENFRAALPWALRRPDPQAALRLCAALWPYWASHESPEDFPAEWMGQVLQLPDLPRGRSLALTTMALAWWTNDTTMVDRALAMADELDDPQLRCTVHWSAAGVRARTDPAAALGHVEIAEAGNYPPITALCGHLRTWAALGQGETRLARRQAERTLRQPLVAITHAMLPWWQGTLAFALAVDGDHEAAAEAAMTALALAKAAGLETPIVMVLTRATAVAVLGEDWPIAAERLRELLRLLLRRGARRFVADALDLVALTLAGTGRPVAVLAMFDAAERFAHHNETPGGGRLPVMAALVDAARARAARSAPSTGPGLANATLDQTLRAALLALETGIEGPG